MKKFYSIFGSKALLLCLLSFICADKLWATYVSGNASGTWTKANSPYVLTGTVTVQKGTTLTIEAGVQVQITTGAIQLLIQGTLNAIGTAADSIKITRVGDLRGNEQLIPVFFDNTSTNCIFQYAVLSNLGYYYHDDTKYAVFIQSSSCKITNCTFQNTYGSAVGIDEAFKPVVSFNNFKANVRLDIVAHPDELKNIYNNDSLKIGLYENLVDIATTDTIKAENNYYRLLTSISVPITQTLIINPGAVVQINSGSIQLSISGTLKALGLPDKSIKIIRNGDLRGNEQLIPVVFEPASVNSVLLNVNISDLGFYYYDDYKPAIFIRTSSCRIDSCFIQNIYGVAIMIGRNAKPAIRNSSIASTNVNVALDPDKLKYLTNNNALTIGLTDSVPMAQNDTLYSTNTSYKLLNVLKIPKTKTLTIDQNAKLYIPTGYIQLIVQGTLLATGAYGSLAQISRIGDFRGNEQVVPIVFDTDSRNSVLHYLSIEGFGYYYNDNTKPSILVKSSSCLFVNTYIQKSRGLAVKIENASPEFRQSCFFNNANGAVLSSSGQARFLHCNFVGNTAGIIKTSTTDIINADSCYWGDASGPYQQITNPTAVGDSVSANVNYTPFNSDPFDCKENSLPLTLLSFQVTLSNNTVACAWQTANEINTRYFNIQRSIDGVNFINLGKVRASGNSTAANVYHFTDLSPANGINYYRLQMVDADGKFTYSQTAPVNISAKQRFVVYPNPVKNTLYVQVQRTSAENVTLQVTDQEGKIVLQQNQQLTAGTTTLFVNITALAKGAYFIVLKGIEIEHKMFVKE